MLPFDPDAFVQNYPQFDYLTSDYLENVFEFEAIVLGQKVIALFCNESQQLYWAQVVLAHILTITALQDTNSNSGLGGTFATGRTSQATEGSVSGSFEFKGTEDSAWWDLTPYGQKCWQLFRKRGGATYYSYATNQSTMEAF